MAQVEYLGDVVFADGIDCMLDEYVEADTNKNR